MVHDNPLIARMQKGKEKQSAGYRRAPKQEKYAAERLGGYRVSGSGSGKIKGDVRKRGVVRLECKCTQHKSFRVTEEMLDKIENAALANDEVAAIHIEFIDKKSKVLREVVVMNASDFFILVEDK